VAGVPTGRKESLILVVKINCACFSLWHVFVLFVSSGISEFHVLHRAFNCFLLGSP